jgi:cyclopropane-fatty-acyl-phospholipid synthase
MSLQAHLPSTYVDVHPHHMLALYTVLTGVTSSGIYKKAANMILSLVSSSVTSFVNPLFYKGLVPDFIMRMTIRLQLRTQLQQAVPANSAGAVEAKMTAVKQLTSNTTDNASQDTSLPPAIYGMCLGPTKKYSAGLWTDKKTTMAESEINMMRLFCDRAGVRNGMKIVDFGCGAGSLSLYIAEKFPQCQITGISNNNAHRRHILKSAAAKNFSNIRVLTVRAFYTMVILRDPRYRR